MVYVILIIPDIKRSFMWKLLERFGFHAVKLAIQIILARVLMPKEFGVLGILLVFIDLSTILVQSGLNSALIQSKDTTDEDYSSVLWISLALSMVIYISLYLLSPRIAEFYSNDAITNYLRSLSIVLFGGSVNSIQIAYASRRFDFRSQFFSNSIAVVVSGIIGIIMAYNGFGIWALITQQILWQYINCLLMSFFIKWKPMFVIDLSRVKVLVNFGWKMLASSLLIRINSMISRLIIGKRYSVDSLAYYTKAANFPTSFSDVVVASISSVTLVSVSTLQGSRDLVKAQVRSFIQNGMFFIAPLIMGLACAASPFIHLVLTEKWLPCVPFLQVFCIMHVFQPVCSIFGQAICGYGRSNLYLRIFLITKPIGLGLMFIVIWLSSDVIYIAICVVVALIIETITQSTIVRNIFGYTFREQLCDWGKPVICSVIMGVPVYLLNYSALSFYLMLVCQIALGVPIYILVSCIVNRASMAMYLQIIRKR